MKEKNMYMYYIQFCEVLDLVYTYKFLRSLGAFVRRMRKREKIKKSKKKNEKERKQKSPQVEKLKGLIKALFNEPTKDFVFTLYHSYFYTQ